MPRIQHTPAPDATFKVGRCRGLQATTGPLRGPVATMMGIVLIHRIGECGPILHSESHLIHSWRRGCSGRVAMQADSRRTRACSFAPLYGSGEQHRLASACSGEQQWLPD